MAMGAAARQASTLPTGLNDVLDQLTLAHAENFDRHGPLLGEAIEAPADAIAFAVQQQQRAAAIDNATDPAAKSAALLAKEAHQHEQIGRLAYYVAGYELAHGDPGNDPAMRELGRDHLQLAAGLWKDAGETMDKKPEDTRPAEALTLEAIERDPMNAVLLPLPAKADLPLLEAASYAAFYAGQWTADEDLGVCAVDRTAEIDHRLSEMGHEGDFIPDMDLLSPQQKDAWHASVDAKFPAIGAWRGDMIRATEQPADDWLAQQDAEILGGTPTSESAAQWDAMIADAKAQPAAPYTAPQSADLSDLMPEDAKAAVKHLNDNDRGNPGRGL